MKVAYSSIEPSGHPAFGTVFRYGRKETKYKHESKNYHPDSPGTVGFFSFIGLYW